MNSYYANTKVHNNNNNKKECVDVFNFILFTYAFILKAK